MLEGVVDMSLGARVHDLCEVTVIHVGVTEGSTTAVTEYDQD